MAIGLMGAAALGSTVLGAGQMIAGAAQKRKAEGLKPDLVDPAMEQRLAEARSRLLQNRQQMRRLQAGSTPEFELARRQIGSQLAGAQQAATQVGGTTRAKEALLQSAGRRAAQGVSGLATAQAQGLTGLRGERGQLEQGITQLTHQLSRRKMELQLAERAQALRESAEARQAGYQNLLGGLVAGAGEIDKLGGLGNIFGKSTSVQPTLTDTSIGKTQLTPQNIVGKDFRLPAQGNINVQQDSLQTPAQLFGANNSVMFNQGVSPLNTNAFTGGISSIPQYNFGQPLYPNIN